jgi:ABC-type transport system involved in multi-copper enzyme maturation permease subunit
MDHRDTWVAAPYRVLGHLRDCWQDLAPLRALWLVAIAIAVLLCLTVRIEGPIFEKVEDELDIPQERGALQLLAGLVRIELFRDNPTVAQFLHNLLLHWMLGPIGLLLSMAGTATVMPNFFRSGSAILLFTSPIRRGLVVVSRYAMTVVLCTGLACLFSLSTAIALAWAIGSWPGIEVGALAIFAVEVGTFLGWSVMLGVWLRHGGLVLVGSVMLWLICQLANITYWQAYYHAAEGAASIPGALTVAYFLLPKPADMAFLVGQMSGIGQHFVLWPELQWAWESGRLHVWPSMLSSLATGLAAVGIAAWETEHAELY